MGNMIMNNSIRTEWEKMIFSGIILVIEYQTCKNDYLIVDIQLSDDNECFFFSFDKDPLCDVYFSGNVTTFSDIYYRYPVDLDMSLDEHIQLIDQEMTEGYLLPNGLFYE